MNILTVSGTVISADFKDASEMSNSSNDLLRVKLSVRTGQRKKEGEDYAPSYILDVPIWGKFATAIKDKVVKGSKMCIAGTLGVPTTYGEGRINMELVNVMNDSFQLFDAGDGDSSGSKAEAAPKATKEDKKKKAATSLLDGDDETAEELDDDIPF